MSELTERLPSSCPTCTSYSPNTYYGSCFDNQHSTIFDPRLQLDPWHEYLQAIIQLEERVESLKSYNKVMRELLAERDNKEEV